ncbi:MAG: SIMPL domain-containing protein [Nanoarchaeota archaeon]
MDTKTLVLIGLIAGILIVGGVYFGFGKKTVSAQGLSTIEIEPDLVAVYFNAQVINKSAEAAKNEVADIVSKLESSLLDIVDEEDITTESFNIYPNYDYEHGGKITGYTASQSIVVKTDRIDKTGRIVDNGVDAGALVSWINFEMSNEHEEQVKAEALEKAAADSKSKAEAIARGLGKRLGGVIEVKTDYFNYYPLRYWEAEAAGGVSVKEAAVNIRPKDLEVSASVQVTYRIW